MKVLIVIAVIIILLLLYSIRIVYSFKLENFSVSAKVVLKTPFIKELFNTEKPKKEKKIAKEERKNKPKKKIDLDTVFKLNEPLTIVVATLCKVIKNHSKITKMDTFLKVALEDPMENGIAFGILSGIFNIAAALLTDKCKVKKNDFRIESDFNSGEGLIFETDGTLKVRPLILILVLIFNFKLIKAIKEILIILKREDIENG